MKCERCEGYGETYKQIESIMYGKKCPDCNGTGEKPESQGPVIAIVGAGNPDIKEAVMARINNGPIIVNPAPPEESREKPLQPVENDDERIREAFAIHASHFCEHDCRQIISGKLCSYLNKYNVKQCYSKRDYTFGFKAGFKSRDEEVERLKKELSTIKYEIAHPPNSEVFRKQWYRKDIVNQVIKGKKKEITALRAQIKELKGE